MIPFNIRWVCGRLKRARKLWMVVSVAAILVLVGSNLIWNHSTAGKAGNLSVDSKIRDDLTTFVDLHQAFDKVRLGSGLTATSSADPQKAFDSRKEIQARLNGLRYPLDAGKTNEIDKNNPLSDAVGLKKALDKKNDLKLNAADPKKAFESKKNDSKLKVVDSKKAFDGKNNNPNRNSAHLKKSPGRTPLTLKTQKLSDEELPAAFVHKLAGQEKSIVFEILQALDTVSTKLDQPYFLCGGTLLGSFRHHDLIPWDDDVDVYMNLTERDTIYSGLSSLSPKFQVFEAGHRMKLYSRWSKSSSQEYSWKFPYVDINFFIENATHIIDSDPVFHSLAYRKEKIFPLHRRPLGGLFLLAPFDTYSYLANTYWNITVCTTSYYDHRHEIVYADLTVKVAMCRRLRDLFPFVYRTKDPDSRGIRETLKFNDTELHTIIVAEPQYVIGDVFHLIPLNVTREAQRDSNNGLE